MSVGSFGYGPRGEPSEKSTSAKTRLDQAPLAQGPVSIRSRRVRSLPITNGDPWRAEPVVRSTSNCSASLIGSVGALWRLGRSSHPPQSRAHKVADAQLVGSIGMCCLRRPGPVTGSGDPSQPVECIGERAYVNGAALLKRRVTRLHRARRHAVRRAAGRGGYFPAFVAAGASTARA